MLGIATLTMLTSSRAMNPATRQMVSAFQRIGSGASVPVGAVSGCVTAPSCVSVDLPAYRLHEIAQRDGDVCNVETPCGAELLLERWQHGVGRLRHLQPGRSAGRVAR